MSDQQQARNTTSDSVTGEEFMSAKSSSAPTTSHPGQAGSSTTGAQPADQQAEESQETTETGETDQEQEGSPNKEAAKYRVRLREAEAQRDQLQARLDAVTDNVLTEKLENVGMPLRLLRRMGADLNAVWTDDGTFSDAALLELVNNTQEELGLKPNVALNKINQVWGSRGVIDWSLDSRSEVVPTAGTGPDGPDAWKGDSGWSDLLNPTK